MQARVGGVFIVRLLCNEEERPSLFDASLFEEIYADMFVVEVFVPGRLMSRPLFSGDLEFVH
jgi:hypothetical protein